MQVLCSLEPHVVALDALAAGTEWQPPGNGRSNSYMTTKLVTGRSRLSSIFVESGAKLWGTFALQSFLGCVVFASQTLPKPKGAVSALFGSLQQHWSESGRHVGWARAALAAAAHSLASGPVSAPPLLLHRQTRKVIEVESV